MRGTTGSNTRSKNIINKQQQRREAHPYGGVRESRY
jgi:hypothetical protein